MFDVANMYLEFACCWGKKSELGSSYSLSVLMNLEANLNGLLPNISRKSVYSMQILILNLSEELLMPFCATIVQKLVETDIPSIFYLHLTHSIFHSDFFFVYLFSSFSGKNIDIFN